MYIVTNSTATYILILTYKWPLNLFRKRLRLIVINCGNSVEYLCESSKNIRNLNMFRQNLIHVTSQKSWPFLLNSIISMPIAKKCVLMWELLQKLQLPKLLYESGTASIIFWNYKWFLGNMLSRCKRLFINQ